MKVIGRSIWDKTVFVMCDCHAELIQFTKMKDATCEFNILYYGDNKTTIEEEYSYGFSFTRASFEDFVDTLRGIVLSPDSDISSVFFDKENMDEDVENGYPKLELFHLFPEINDCVTIRRLGHFKKSKDDVVWEILLDEDSAKQLLDELETWLDDEEVKND